MPLDPTTPTTVTTTTTTTTTATSPLPQPRLHHHYPFPQPHHHQEQPFPIHIPNPLLPKQPHDPSNPFPFPFLSPGRGGAPLKSAYPQPPSLLYPHGVRAVASPHLDYAHPALHLTRPPPHFQYPHVAYSPVAASVKGGAAVAQSKATPRSGVSDSKNGYKDTSARESRDDTLTVVRGRKVKITEDASLYSICRSWLRNGINEDIQPPQKDVINTLPKPFPPSTEASNIPNKEEDENVEDEQEEDEKSVDHLSPQDLLKRHVQRAKRVRARSREERLQRIKRYRNRLTLLLPPAGEK